MDAALCCDKESAKTENMLAMKVFSGFYKLAQMRVEKNKKEAQRGNEIAKTAEKKP